MPKVTMPTLIAENKRRESVKDFIERFRNLILRYSDGMPIFQTHRHNLLTNNESDMDVVKAST